MKKAEDGEDGVTKIKRGENKDQPQDLETHQEIPNLIAWGASLTKSALSCKRTFEDLLERLVQTGLFFANLAKHDQDVLVKDVGTNLEGVAASLRPVLELIDLCREPSLQLHLLLQHEEILKRAALLGGMVGLKVEDLINESLRKGVELEQKALKRAVNAAYQLQYILYAIDDGDRDDYDKIRGLVQKRQSTKDSNASSFVRKKLLQRSFCLNCIEKVSYINGEPLQLFSEMLVRGALSGATANHKYIKDNAELKSICEKVAMGDIDGFDEKVPEGEQFTASRKARNSIHAGVWTRLQPLSIDSTISRPRVLWEVDTPIEISVEDSLENFRFDIERSTTESAAKDSKGKVGVEIYPDTGSSKAQDPPPPEIQDVSGGDLEPLPCSRATRRISFIPGQEGG